MAIPLAHICHVFGFRTGISGCLGFLDENTIIYPCGSNLVLYNMETRVQRFMAGLKKSEDMNAMAVSPNRRFLALAERAEKKPIITIFDLQSLKKVKTLFLPSNLMVNNFVHIVFSPDSKFLAAQGNEVDWNLILWSWEKAKLLTYVKTATGMKANISQISFNLNDNTQLCVVGDGILKNYRYVDTEKNLRQFGKAVNEHHTITCHAWLTDDTVVMGTKTGLLFLVKNGVKKSQFDMNVALQAAELAAAEAASLAVAAQKKKDDNDTQNFFKLGSKESFSREFVTSSDEEKKDEAQQQTATVSTGAENGSSPVYPVTSIVSFTGGFAAACGPGSISWFECVEDSETDSDMTAVTTVAADDEGKAVVGVQASFPYDRTYEIRIPQDPNSADPVQWASSQVISQMAISPDRNSMVCSSDSHQLYQLFFSSLEMIKHGGHCYMELLSSQSFHHDTIVGLAVCLRKPIIATCSSDNSIRIWNFETNTLELYKEFAEEIFSIALHPTGLHILVGFSDKLRLMNLLIDDIRTYKDFNIRNCRECSFSTGGQLIAAVNNHLIVIYSATTFQLTATLKGHNGKIRSLLWSTDDRKLISCGTDGAVYEWDPFTGARLNESVLKSCGYNDIAITGDGKTTYAVGNDKSLKEVNESQITREINNDVVLTTVALSHSGRMLLCGTSQGTVRAYKFPLTSAGEFQENQGHCSAVTRMRITHNDEYMITVSEDCSVIIWTIQDRDGRGLVKENETNWSDEILITKFDLEQKNSMMTELKTRVEELKVENEYQLRLKDMNYREKISDITRQFVGEMEALRVRNDRLHAERDAAKHNHEEQLVEVTERHTQELTEVQEEARQMLKTELVKYHELLEMHRTTTDNYEAKLSAMGVSREVAMEELNEYYETKMHEKTRIVNNLTNEMRDQSMQFDTQRRLVEEDADREILDIKINYERRLKEERENNARLKGETGVMRKKFNTLNKEILDQKEEIKKYKNEMAKLDLVIRTLEKEIQGLKKEVQERDETIQDKEKRIYDLKKKNQELEKFKFVLDYKVKELRKQIEPREREIRAYKEQIKNMELELDNFAKQGIFSEVTISELNQKLQSSERQLIVERGRTRAFMTQLDRIKTEIHNSAGLIQSPKQLRESIVAIFHKYVTSDERTLARTDPDINEEFEKHREHLEKTVRSMAQKITKDTEVHRCEYIRIMKENVTLITEINCLRRELKNARSHNQDLEATMHLTRREGATAQEVLSVIKDKTSNATFEKDVLEARNIIDAQRNTICILNSKLESVKSTMTMTDGIKTPISISRAPSGTKAASSSQLFNETGKPVLPAIN